MDTKRTNIVCVFLALLCTIMFFSGCSTESLNWNPQGDWMYELCRGYYISRSSSSSIALVKEQKIGYSYVVEEYVTCFCYNDDFIAVRKLVIPEHTMFEDIMKMDFSMAMYYLINTQNDDVLGPFSDKESFEIACSKQKTEILNEWIPTYPPPPGAKF